MNNNWTSLTQTRSIFIILFIIITVYTQNHQLIDQYIMINIIYFIDKLRG